MGGRGASSGSRKGNSFTGGELDALENYIAGDGMWINNYGRDIEGAWKPSDLDDNDRAYLADLKRATDRNLGAGKTLYRGAMADEVFGKMDQDDYQKISAFLEFGSGGKDAKAKTDQFIKKMTGKTVTDKGFMSTTKSYNIASSWHMEADYSRPIVLELRTGRKTKGVDIAKASKRLDSIQGEDEVLLRNNSRYKIKGITSRDGLIHVKADLE